MKFDFRINGWRGIGVPRPEQLHRGAGLMPRQDPSPVSSNFIKIFLIITIFLIPTTPLIANDAITEKKAEIAELDKEIAELKNKKATTDAEASLIEKQLKKLEGQVAAARLEYRQTQSDLSETETEYEANTSSIEQIQAQQEIRRQKMKRLLKARFREEQVSLLAVFLDSGTLSDVLNKRAAINEIQRQSSELLGELKEEEQSLRKAQDKLEEQQQELSLLSDLLEKKQADIASQEASQKEFLSLKKAEQAKFENKIKEAEAAKKEIEAGLFALQDVGIKVSLNTAEEMALHASSLTGVRPEVLMAMLKVESGIGTNIGSGVFPEDMHPKSREPFVRIAAQLGREVSEMPISRRRSYGWGGAMGPGQIMPQTWEGIAPRVAELAGVEIADPYDLSHAFIANAMMLADRGAAAGGQAEYEAINRYLAGPNWQRFTWYGDRVLAIATEYASQF